MRKRYRIMGATILVLIAISIYTGFTYAAWNARFTQSETNKIVAGCFEMRFEETKSSISLKGTYPMDDIEGLKKEGYGFEIKNTCSIYGEYQIVVDIENSTTIDENKIKVVLEGEMSPKILGGLEEVEINEEGYRKTYIIKEDGLRNIDEKKEYEIKLWIDASAGNEVMGQSLKARVRIISVAAREPNPTLYDSILAQYGGKEAINEAPANTFASTSDTSTNVMYKMEDDYGMSYYYRGAKDLLNNNLIFANHQWKIVRINGDGSIRIIYNGVCPNNTCTINSTGTATQIKTAPWNLTNNNDNKYVGYMYGGANGVASTSRAQAVTNETSSNAKIELESWYATHIETPGYASYISDTLFCNDKRLQSEVGGAATGTGFGTSQTHYAAYHRLVTNKTPTLLCGNKNDKFTVSDVSIGNGDLSKPVGLITVDEAALAGGVYNTVNTSYYLHTNQTFMVVSPIRRSSFYACMGYVTGAGNLYDNAVSNTNGIRNVINLNSDVRVTGTGSEADPFIVQ